MSELETISDPSATSPGAILKRCREYHEISLAEAAETTKIGENYLVALEDEQLSAFASLAYLKGFLRIYATYLGLNPDDMIRLYDKLYSAERTRTDRPARPDSTAPRPRRKFPLQKLLMPALFLVLILLTAAIVNRSPSNRPLPAAPSPVAVSAPLPAIQQPRSSSGRAIETKKPVEPESDTKPAVAPPAAPATAGSPAGDNSRGFIVRMKVTQGGTLKVTIDGSTSQGYELAAGDSIEWKADRSIAFELSNAGGVEAELDGRPLKPFGQAGKPAFVVLDAEGIRP